MNDTLIRWLVMLSLIPRQPLKIDTKRIKRFLEDRQYKITLRSIQRDLNKLSMIFPLIGDNARPQGWYWRADSAQFSLPALDLQNRMSAARTPTSSAAVAVFLDDPKTHTKSPIQVEFSPVDDLQTVADAIFYIAKLCPMPLLLYRRGDVNTKETVVESIGGQTKLAFSRVPSTSDPDSDLAEILEWFENANVPVELLPIDVIEWFPQQFRGATHWLGMTIEPGWMPIVADVCQHIQSALTPAELERFHWIQIRQEWGKLALYWEPRHRVVVSPASPSASIKIDADVDDRDLFYADDSDFGPASAAKSEFDAVIAREMDISAAARQKVEEIIVFAQRRATRTCEHCGAAGRLRHEPTINVLCDDCLDGWKQATSGEFDVANG